MLPARPAMPRGAIQLVASRPPNASTVRAVSELQSESPKAGTCCTHLAELSRVRGRPLEQASELECTPRGVWKCSAGHRTRPRVPLSFAKRPKFLGQ